MNKYRIYSVLLILLIVFLTFGLYASETNKGRFANFPFQLGLDLAGGTELIYKADVSEVAVGEVNDAMATLRDVIERRVNTFGVSEPIVQVEQGSIFGDDSADHRLIVGLPGVTNIEEARSVIGETPVLEFKILDTEASTEDLNQVTEEGDPQQVSVGVENIFIDTGLTGSLLSNARLDFSQGQATTEPIVVVNFNNEGTELLAEITRDNIGETLAIFLDGEAISMPVIRDEITNGSAVISGAFDAEEAKLLVRNLNFGALPVPVELISTASVGPSLGHDVLSAGVQAGLIGLLVVSLFMLVWYRLPGFVSVVALLMYGVVNMWIYKLIPVTLTAAGIAGFIVSIGMAVDANILIFERLKEELAKGKGVREAAELGFARAWLSIRDSNLSSIITAIVLFWIGTSSVKGFALTFGIGVIVSMITAVTFSRVMLYALAPEGSGKLSRLLFSAGIRSHKE